MPSRVVQCMVCGKGIGTTSCGVCGRVCCRTCIDQRGVCSGCQQRR
ncbi:hypothetical protein HYS47_05320 [Candidatus Woesearchaeota archaeon]|nr:hypothetical protein [Candidatus Woesearchaeota archaeon]